MSARAIDERIFDQLCSWRDVDNEDAALLSRNQICSIIEHHKRTIYQARIAGLREAAEIVADLDTKYIGAQGCFKEAQRTILARITELEKP